MKERRKKGNEKERRVTGKRQKKWLKTINICIKINKKMSTDKEKGNVNQTAETKTPPKNLSLPRMQNSMLPE